MRFIIYILLFCFVPIKAQEVDTLFIVPLSLENKVQETYHKNIVINLNKELVRAIKGTHVYTLRTKQQLKKIFSDAKIKPNRLYNTKYRKKNLPKLTDSISYFIEGEVTFPTPNDIAVGVRLRKVSNDSIIKSTALHSRVEILEKLSQDIAEKILPKNEEIIDKIAIKYKKSLKKKNLSKANAFCDWGLRIQPHNPHFLYAKGKLLEEEKKYIQAQKHYKDALRLRYPKPQLVQLAINRVTPLISQNKKEYRQDLKKLFKEFSAFEKELQLQEIQKVAVEVQLHTKKIKHLQKIIDETVKLKKETSAFLVWMNKLHGSTVSHKNQKLAKDMRSKIGEYKTRQKNILSELQKHAASNGIFIKKAKKAYRNKKYEKSLHQATLAGLLNPQDPEAHYYKGISQGKKYKYKEAVGSFSKAVKYNPKYWEAWFNRGATYLAAGKKGEAFEDFSQVLKIQPHAETHLEVGRLLEERNKEKQALSHYSKAIKLNPTLAYAYYERGKIHDRHNKHVAATQDYQKAMTLDAALAARVSPLYDKSKSNVRQQALVFVEIGQDYQQYGDLDIALKNYNNALKLNDSLFIPFFYKGQISYIKGLYKEAIKNYNRALKIEKENPQIYLHRAIAFLKMKKYNKALQDLESTVKIAPNLSDAYLTRGRVYEELARGKKDSYLRLALQSYDLAVKLIPSKSHYYLKRAHIQELLGSEDLAEQDRIRARSVKK